MSFQIQNIDEKAILLSHSAVSLYAHHETIYTKLKKEKFGICKLIVNKYTIVVQN